MDHLGTKEVVDAAKITVEALVKDIENITEKSISVDPKHHSHFLARRGELLRRIGDECGGVAISFPWAGDKVNLKGSGSCIDAAVSEINAIVKELEDKVTIECDVEHKYHRFE